MKKIIICLTTVLLTTFCFAQKSVAVYVTSTDTLNESTKQIIGSELVAGIVTYSEYIAVERTKEFLGALQQEQDYSPTQIIDDQKIRDIGKQFGVSIVCVANIMPYQNAYYIQARMLNVQTATIEATARETSTLSFLSEIVTASETLASKLMTQVKEKQAAQAIADEEARQRQLAEKERQEREEEIQRQEAHEAMVAKCMESCKRYR